MSAYVLSKPRFPDIENCSLRSHQHPLLWDKCNDGRWRWPGSDHPAGLGDEEDGAEHVRRPEHRTKRQPRRKPWSGGGPCEEKVCLLMLFSHFPELTLHWCRRTSFQIVKSTKIWYKLERPSEQLEPISLKAILSLQCENLLWCYLFTGCALSEKEEEEEEYKTLKIVYSNWILVLFVKNGMF